MAKRRNTRSSAISPPRVANVPSQISRHNWGHSSDKHESDVQIQPDAQIQIGGSETKELPSYPSRFAQDNVVPVDTPNNLSEVDSDHTDDYHASDSRLALEDHSVGKRKDIETSSVANARDEATPGSSGFLGLFFNNFKKSRDSGTDPVPPSSNEQISQKRAWNLPKMKQIVKTEELKETDTVVALMGPTGSGKSSFISSVADSDIGVGHSLVSCTSEVNVVRVRVPDEELDIVLVDTPGFDDTHKSDYEILKLIRDWLEQAGHNKILLDGILYLHRISDNRMAGTPLRNLEVFEKICGPKACSRVVMMTTMWDELDDEETGETRQEELEATFWKPMIDRGSKTERYRNTSESAWRILEPFFGNQRQRLAALQSQKETVLQQQKQKGALRLQQETAQQHKALSSTDAGQALYEKIDKLDKLRKSLMRTLEKQMNRRGTDKEIVELLRRQYDNLEKEREAALEELHKLKVPMPQRLIKSVGMKKRYWR